MNTNTEIELKYSVDSIEKGLKVLESPLISEYEKSESRKTIQMKAIYYDDKDLTLANNRIGYRVRKENDVYIATFKYSGNNFENGLSKRVEYNVPVKSEFADTKAFDGIIQDKEIADIFAAVKPEPMFTTKFERKIVVVNYKNSEIEVAFDSGRIFSGNKSVPICELECELKSGEEKDLTDFGNLLKTEFNLSPLSFSKLQRGLELI